MMYSKISKYKNTIDSKDILKEIKENDRLPESIKHNAQWVKDIYKRMDVSYDNTNAEARSNSILEFERDAENIGRLDYKTRENSLLKEYIHNKYIKQGKKITDNTAEMKKNDKREDDNIVQKIYHFDSDNKKVSNAMFDDSSGISIQKFSASINPRIDYRTYKESEKYGVSGINQIKSFSVSKEANDAAKKYAKNKGVEDVNNNEVDAYRHFYWNYEMCNNMKPGDALRCSSAHEIAFLQEHNLVTYSHTGKDYERDAFMPLSVIMDVLNNRTAVTTYMMDDYSSVEEAFEECLAKGKIITDPNKVCEKLGIDEKLIVTKQLGESTLWGLNITFMYMNGVIVSMRLDESKYDILD